MKFKRNSATPRSKEDGKLSVKTTITAEKNPPENDCKPGTDLESNILPKIIAIFIEIIPNKFRPKRPNYESFWKFWMSKKNLHPKFFTRFQIDDSGGGTFTIGKDYCSNVFQ
jgi:hypothetical protein